MKKIAILTAALIMALLCAAFSGRAPVDYTADFYFNDYASVLNSDVRKLVLEENEKLYDRTGGQIVVLTVPGLNGTEIEGYAYNVFNGWGVGSAGRNNGLLILLAIAEQDYWVMPGIGTERFISTADISDILYSDMEPDFARGDYSAAVKKTFKSFLAKYIENYYAEYYTQPTPKPGSYPGYVPDMPGPGGNMPDDGCGGCIGCGLGAAACGIGCSSCIGGGGGGIGILLLVLFIVIISGISRGGGGPRGRRRRNYPPRPPFGGGGGFSGRPGGGFGRGGGGRSGGFGGRPGGGASRGGGAGRR